MIINKEEDYVLRILRSLYLNSNLNNGLVSAKTISEHEGVTKNEVLKILSKLRVKNIVESVKGNKGGYKLIIDVKKTTLLDLCNLMGKDLYINDCLNPCNLCTNNNNDECGVRKKLQRMQNILFEELARDTLYEIITMIN